ncbi:WXG100 family type VII secretion target [Umezawaea beigongshangensis]|uniref:WXG100 family type VII secretion target n=1 Tax=Umezawaea beigongshangensis TaxID=2780383 RepID=UPI0018F26271|nr:hypothetical protein [Umezawaea beigongshangensis]
MTTAQAAPNRDPAHLINDVKGTVAAVERGDWVAAGVGITNTAMSVVGLATNPLGGLVSAGFSWAVQHVDFLKEPFDVLLGDPDAVATMARNWKSAGTQLASIAADYRTCSVRQTSSWTGQAADNYRAASANHAGGLETLARATTGMAGAVEGAGQLVAAVRKVIMDLIGDAVTSMVMSIVQWLSVSWLTFGASIAKAIVDVVQKAVSTAQKLAEKLSKLASSLQKLISLVQKVAQIVQTAKQLVDTLTAKTKQAPVVSGGGLAPAPGTGLTSSGGRIDSYTGRHTATGVRPATDTGGHWVPGHWEPGYTPPRSSAGAPPPPGRHGSSGVRPGPRYTPPSVPRGAWTTTGSLDDTDTSSFSSRAAALPGAPSDVDHRGAFSGGGGGSGAGFSAAGLSGGGSSGAVAFGGDPGVDGGGAGAGAGGSGGAVGGSGGGVGGGGGGTPGPALAPGGASGVVPTSSAVAGAPVGVPGAGGGSGPGAGTGGAGMMGGAPMTGAGAQGDAKEHQRKVRIEGQQAEDVPRAAKPVIGE